MANGSETSKIRVGAMKALGQGTDKQFDDGIAIVQEVADTGSQSALMMLGDLLIGPGAAIPDVARAMDAYEKVGKLGNADGWLRLGDLYRDGKLVPADGQKAASYYLKAADAAVPIPVAELPP